MRLIFAFLASLPIVQAGTCKAPESFRRQNLCRALFSPAAFWRICARVQPEYKRRMRNSNPFVSVVLEQLKPRPQPLEKLKQTETHLKFTFLTGTPILLVAAG
jgi:hypothetical protein